MPLSPRIRKPGGDTDAYWGPTEEEKTIPVIRRARKPPAAAYIGIDPGASGGLAVLLPDGTAEACPMPATERDVWDWVNGWQGTPRPFAVIEKVGGYVRGSRGNIGSAMFKFGTSYGGLRMALVAAGIPFDEAAPVTWQLVLGLSSRTGNGSGTKRAAKAALKSKAQQLFPKVKVTLATADALLLAEFCRRKREGTL